MTTLRVLIADDHAPTRVGIRMSLEEAGMVVADEVATAGDAVDAAVRTHPDIALLDINMPGNGIDAARAITERAPGTAIIMLTVSQDDSDLFDALRAGARGYLLKEIDPERLPQALAGVLTGEAALPRQLVARVINEFRARERTGVKPSGPLAKLSTREWEVLDFMRQGLTTREIADKLFVAPVTVRSHVSSILSKLHVPSRDAAVRLTFPG